MNKWHMIAFGALGGLLLDLARPAGKVDLPILGSLPTVLPGAAGKGILDGFLKPKA